jgi:hypothetical protein
VVALRNMGNAVSVGTVVLGSLLLIFGSLFTLSAMWFELGPKRISAEGVLDAG